MLITTVDENMQGNGHGRRFGRTGLMVTGALAAVLFLGGCGSDSSGDKTVADTGASKGTAGTSAPGAATKADGLAFSKCMRDHGVKNFPDPNAQGQIWLGSPGQGGGGLDPSSPQFSAAQNACKSLAPGGSPEQQKTDRTNALKYSKCMRSHGAPNFPDPDSSGGIKTDNNAVDPNTPQFKAAEKACAEFQPGGPNAPRGQFGVGGGA